MVFDTIKEVQDYCHNVYGNGVIIKRLKISHKNYAKLIQDLWFDQPYEIVAAPSGLIWAKNERYDSLDSDKCGWIYSNMFKHKKDELYFIHAFGETQICLT